MKQPPREQICMRLTPEAHEYLRDYAASKGIKPSAAVELILREHKDQTEKGAKK